MVAPSAHNEAWADLDWDWTVVGLSTTACRNALVVNGSDRRYFETMYARGLDPLHRSCEWAWMRAPDELVEAWSSDFTFDNPMFSWVYAQVGWNRGANRVDEPPFPLQRLKGPTYVVSGLLPYATYSTLSAETVMNGDTGVPFYWTFRVRYWVGLMHHFSFFTPPSGGAGSGGLDGGGPGVPSGDALASGRWDTSDLRSDVWDASSGRVSERGRFAHYWTALVDSLELSAAWEDPEEGPSEQKVLFSSVPTDNLNGAVHRTYQRSLKPTPLCFSDQDAAVSADDEMTSFLGESIWGDACICVQNPEGRRFPTEAALQTQIAEGFRLLFGAEVRLGYLLKFYSPDGANPATGLPYSVGRYFCMTADDLEGLANLSDRLKPLRDFTTGTAEYRWLLREFDEERLQLAKTAAAGTPCP